MGIERMQRYKYVGWAMDDSLTVHLQDMEIDDFLQPLGEAAEAIYNTASRKHRDLLAKNMRIVCEDSGWSGSSDTSPITAEQFEKGMDDRITSNRSWYGDIDNIAQLNEMLWSGWPEGAKRVDGFADSLEVDAEIAAAFEEIPDARRKLRWKDDGDDIDIHKVYDGQLDRAWRKPHRRAGGIRALSLVIQFGGNAGQSSEQMFWNGAAGLALAYLLEGAGYSVELIGANAQGNLNDDNSMGCQMVRLKRRDEPLRIDALAAVVCHAGTFRTHSFTKGMSSASMGESKADYGLGRCIDLTCADFTQWPIDGEPFVVPPAYDKETAKASVLALLDTVKGAGQ